MTGRLFCFDVFADISLEGLVAVTGESSLDHFGIGVGGSGGTTEIPFAFVAHASGQVAGASLAVLGLALCRQAEAFFCAFVCLLLGHGIGPSLGCLTFMGCGL